MASSSNGNGYHLTQDDMTDREILALMADNADDDDLVEAWVIAAAHWPRVFSRTTDSLTPEQRTATACASRRLSWMRRIGIVLRTDQTPARWGRTREGNTLLAGHLTGNQATAIKSLRGATLVLAVHELADRPMDDMVSVLARRAWRHGMVRR